MSAEVRIEIDWDGTTVLVINRAPGDPGTESVAADVAEMLTDAARRAAAAVRSI